MTSSHVSCCLIVPVQRKDFPSNSFYVVVVVKTEDEACGGPLRFYPLRPDELIDAGNRSKILDVVVSPAIDCELRDGCVVALCSSLEVMHSWCVVGLQCVFLCASQRRCM